MTSMTDLRTIKPRTAGDKYSFLAILVIGAAGIIGLKSYYEAELYRAVAWPIGWMFIYLFLITRVESFRLRPDQAGDNLYYLGFLYTLTSLSVALYHFAGGRLELDYIVSNFGIALASTILGVALRVVLHQMREDPTDVERDARLSLAQSASRLRAELNEVVVSMNGFRRQTEQSIAEGLQELGERANSMLAESAEKYVEMATRASGGLEQVYGDYLENVKKMNVAHGRTLVATEKLIERIERIEAPEDLIERKVVPVTERILALAAETEGAIQQMTQAIGAMSQAAVEIENHALAMKGSTEAVSGFAEGIEKLLLRIERIDSSLTGTAEALSGLSDLQARVADGQKQALAEQLSNLEQINRALDAQVAEFREAMRKHTEKGSEETLEAMRGLARRQHEAYETFARRAGETLTALQEYNQRIEAEVARSREATEQVFAQLTSMTRLLAEQLGGRGPTSD